MTADSSLPAEVINGAQEYIDRMVSDRGYVLDYHKIMARYDFGVLNAVNDLVSAAYLDARSLSRKTKELLFVLSLTVLKAPAAQLESHIKAALRCGASEREVLEALEIALPEAGIVAFQFGLEAWARVINAERLEPTVPVAE